MPWQSSAKKVDWWHKIEHLPKEADDTANKILLSWANMVGDGRERVKLAHSLTPLGQFQSPFSRVWRKMR